VLFSAFLEGHFHDVITRGNACWFYVYTPDTKASGKMYFQVLYDFSPA
jgi:hypothetical protein